MMSIEAKLAIHETIAQYAHAYDGKDADGFARVFIENGVFEIYVPGRTRPVVRLRSRKEIREWAAQRLRERSGRFTGRHFQSGIQFDELTDTEARVRVMVLVTRQEATATRPYVNLTGVYHDVWRKTPSGWRLAHRAAYTDRDPGFSKPRGMRPPGRPFPASRRRRVGAADTGR
jgi:ketosteroid isomerase-like protein